MYKFIGETDVSNTKVPVLVESKILNSKFLSRNIYAVVELKQLMAIVLYQIPANVYIAPIV